MRRRIKKFNLTKKLLFYAVLISVLSFTGISYAYWTDSISVDMSVKTGKINIEDKTIETDKNIIINKPKNTVYIVYNIENNGSIPVKLNEENIKPNNLTISKVKWVDGIKTLTPITIDESGLTLKEIRFLKVGSKSNVSEVIEPGNGNIKLGFSGSKNGTYHFELKVPYTQFNSNGQDGFWSKDLIISGEIDVKIP